MSKHGEHKSKWFQIFKESKLNGRQEIKTEGHGCSRSGYIYKLSIWMFNKLNTSRSQVLSKIV